MVDIAEALPPLAEPAVFVPETRERQHFRAFVAALIIAQVLWLSALAFGVYAVVT